MICGTLATHGTSIGKYWKQNDKHSHINLLVCSSQDANLEHYCHAASTKEWKLNYTVVRAFTIGCYSKKTLSVLQIRCTQAFVNIESQWSEAAPASDPIKS